VTKTTKPLISIMRIPRYFGGNGDNGTIADILQRDAMAALVALTGRDENDPAVKLILHQLEDAQANLMDMACEWGRCIPDGLASGIDEWDDDVLLEVTGYSRPPDHPDAHTPT
jgi:hypothetical protein